MIESRRNPKLGKQVSVRTRIFECHIFRTIEGCGVVSFFFVFFFGFGEVHLHMVRLQPSFDLVGPKVDVHVKRGEVTLPIGQVPNLLPGDRLWIHPDFPESQSTRYRPDRRLSARRHQSPAS